MNVAVEKDFTGKILRIEQGLFPEKELQLNKDNMIKAQASINKISIKEFNNQQP